MFDAADQAGAHPLWRAGQFDRFNPFGELAEHRLQFQSGQVSAETEMLADTEREMMIRIAPDIEGIRVCEDLFVAVGRRVEQGENLILLDLLPVQLGMEISAAGELDHGR